MAQHKISVTVWLKFHCVIVCVISRKLLDKGQLRSNPKMSPAVEIVVVVRCRRFNVAQG